jgi:hypothetical protein
MNDETIRQFKLTSSEEIIAEILYWPEDEDDDQDIIIVSAMKIQSVINPDGNSFHTIRPWMTYQTSKKNPIKLNYGQVIGEAIPTDDVINQWKITVAYLNEGKDDEPEDVQDQVEEPAESQGDNVVSLSSFRDKMH